MWDTATGALVRLFEGHLDAVTDVTLSADGTRALSSSNDRTVRLWDVATGQLIAAYSSDVPVAACALSSSAPAILAAGDQSGRVHFLRLHG